MTTDAGVIAIQARIDQEFQIEPMFRVSAEGFLIWLPTTWLLLAVMSKRQEINITQAHAPQYRLRKESNVQENTKVID